MVNGQVNDVFAFKTVGSDFAFAADEAANVGERFIAALIAE